MGQIINNITIYKRDGEERHKLNRYSTIICIKSAEQKKELLGEDTVTIKVQSVEPLSCLIGDYIKVYGQTYTMNKPPEVIKSGLTSYETTLVFEGLQYKLLDVQYRNTDAGGKNPTAVFSIMADMKLLMQVLINNANRVGEHLGETWTLGECPSTESVDFSFSNQNSLAVLQDACKKFEYEFDIQETAVKTYTLNVRKKSHVIPLVFDYSKQSGVISIKRKNVNTNGIVTRLYAEGGTTNIGRKYRGGALRLRMNTNDESYIEDATAKALYGIKESSVQFDDIYPQRKAKVTGIVQDNILQFEDSTMFNLKEQDDTGNSKWLIEGTSAKVKFTGNSSLAGYEFEVSNYDHVNHRFTINKYEDKRGLKIPDGGSYAIKKGDEYILYDIIMPDDPYIKDAEARLQAKAEEELRKNSQPKVDYEIDISSMSLERIQGIEDGIANVFDVGDYIHIVDSDIGVDKQIRIKGFTRNAYDEPYSYKLTLSDTLDVSLIEKIIDDTKRHEEAIVINDLLNLDKARRNWRTTSELHNIIFDGDGYFDTGHIKPNSIETMMLSVGNRASQFVIKDMTIEANALNNGTADPNTIKVIGTANTQLIHYAIEETEKTWTCSGSLTYTLANDNAYYIYAKCSKSSSSFSVYLSQTKKNTEDNTDYYFLIGVLSSVYNGYRDITLTYGATRITGRTVNCGRIESVDKSTYFDLDKAEIAGSIKFRSSDGSMRGVSELETTMKGELANLMEQSNTNSTRIEELQGTSELLQEGISTQGTTINEMQGIINGHGNTLQEIQGMTEKLKEQQDGTIEYWYGGYIPTLYNYPASNWTTEETRAYHNGDIFTNTSTGQDYKFTKKNGMFSWEETASSGVGTAIQEASKAYDLAGSKNHVYVTESPLIKPPATYKTGDLWVTLSDGKMKYCKADAAGSYQASDWQDAGYTDDTTANIAMDKLSDLADDGIITVSEKLQLKTMWQELHADYAVMIAHATEAGVDTNAMVSAHDALNSIVSPILENMKEDSVVTRLVFDDCVASYYNARAELLKKLNERKNSVYVTKDISEPPTAKYKTGDLWVMLNNYKVKICVSDYAGSYKASDWKDAGYTDDTAANIALSQLSALASDSIITPSEKLTLKSEMSNINADYAGVSAQATVLGIDTTQFENVMTALVNYVTPFFTNMAVNSSVNREEYDNKFAAYYTVRADIQAQISKKYVDDIEIGQGNYIANGAFFTALTGWSYRGDSGDLYQDSSMGSVMRFSKTNTTNLFLLHTGYQSKQGNLMMPDNEFKAGVKYTLAFWVKGSKEMLMNVGVMEPEGQEQVAPYRQFKVTTIWQRIVYTFTATDKSQADTRLFIRGEQSVAFSWLLFTKFVLTEGSKAPEWTDSSREFKAQLEANKQTLAAITDNYTQIEGGLILSTFLKLGAKQESGIYQESAGVKARISSDNEVAAYMGGTLAEATAEKDGMTIIYHNGKFVASNAKIKGHVEATSGTFSGTVNASDGEFKGSINIGNGKIILRKDGSGDIGNGMLSWDYAGTVLSATLMRIAILESYSMYTESLTDGQTMNFNVGVAVMSSRSNESVNLPSSPNTGRPYTIINDTNYNKTINGNGKTIRDGNNLKTSITLKSFERVMMICADKWYVVSRYNGITSTT